MRESLKQFFKKAGGRISPAGELYQKLTRLQKISFFVVSGVLLAALVVAFSPPSGSSYRAVLTERGQEGAARLQELVTLLDENSIPWRERTGENGLRSIEVPAGESYRRAASLLEREGSDSSSLPGPEWPYQGGSFLVTPERFQARLLDFNRRRIEQAILWNKGIQKVTIGLPRSPAARYVGERGSGDSAAVALQLKSGVTALQRSEAEAIRSMVSCAFNLKPDKVSISDNLGRSYPPGLAVSLDIQEQEERYRANIQEVVQGFCRRAFGEEEFYVGVIVSLSSQRSSVEREEVDRERTFTQPTRSEYEREDQKPRDDPSSGGILSQENPRRVVVRERTEEVPFVTREKTSIDIPPGQVKAVSVNVLLELEAVERVLGKESAREQLASLSSTEREARIREYEKRQEDALGKLLRPLVDSSVCVMVHPFKKEEPRNLVAAAVPPPRSLELRPEDSGTLSLRWHVVVAAVLASLLVLFLPGLLRRLKERSVQAGAPELAYAALDRAEGNPACGGGRVDLAGLSAQRDRLAHRALQDGLLRSVSDISTLVRKRPDVAASVLRFWLAHDNDEKKEGSARQ